MNLTRTYGKPMARPDGVLLPSEISFGEPMPAMDQLLFGEDGQKLTVAVHQLDTATLSIARAMVVLTPEMGRHAIQVLTAIVERLERVRP